MKKSKKEKTPKSSKKPIIIRDMRDPLHDYMTLDALPDKAYLKDGTLWIN